MDWQGIPFRFLEGDMVDHLSVALNSIPKINIEIPTDYTAAIATVTATLIAGLIPGALSWWLFRRNTENTRKEREEQQLFLKTERAEQQAFLKNEREAQIKSLEEDRKVQLEISKQNFNMQVLSSNRQVWVNELRDRIADVIALAPLYQYAIHDTIIAREHSEKLDLIVPDESCASAAEKEKIYNNRVEASNKFLALVSSINGYKKDMSFLIAKITLMLNPNEQSYTDIISSLNKINLLCNTIEKADINIFGESYSKLLLEIKALTNYTQNCLKAEWERVKKGI